VINVDDRPPVSLERSQNRLFQGEIPTDVMQAQVVSSRNCSRRRVRDRIQGRSCRRFLDLHRE